MLVLKVVMIGEVAMTSAFVYLKRFIERMKELLKKWRRQRQHKLLAV
jgi:hypothetical protein